MNGYHGPVSRRPNIVFVQSDQQRWDALGAVSPLVRTPHLDALAARGTLHEQAVCQVPICMPSRYSTLLGLYGFQAGTRHNTQMIPDDGELPVPTLAMRLKALGYRTACFGKTHWYEGEPFFPGDFPLKPSRRGFDHVSTIRRTPLDPADVTMEDELPDACAALAVERRAYGGGGEDPAGYAGSTSAVPADRHDAGWLTAKACAWLDGRRSAADPFFLYLTFNCPHPGFGVPAGYEARYNLDTIPDRPRPPWPVLAQPPGHVGPPRRWREAWERMDARERRRTTLRYWALCTYVDDCVGRILAAVSAAGEAERTLVVYTSDHGEMLGDRGHRFSKYCLYEGAVRVPLILAGPGVPSGRRDTRPCELVDLMPTLLAAVGAPAEAGPPGLNLLADGRRDGSFAEYHGSGYEAARAAPSWMWRTPEWKLILSARGGGMRGELYDLKADPGEWTNRFDDAACAAVRRALTERLIFHLGQAGADWPPNPEGRGWTEEGNPDD